VLFWSVMVMVMVGGVLGAGENGRDVTAFCGGERGGLWPVVAIIIVSPSFIILLCSLLKNAAIQK
jgi:hypothetical protein